MSGTPTDLQIGFAWMRGHLQVKIWRPDETWAEVKVPARDVRRIAWQLVCQEMRRKLWRS